MRKEEIKSNLKTVFTPENISGLKIHIYNEKCPIQYSMWKRLVVPEDRLKALKDEHGEMWLAINARKHGDIVEGLREIEIEVVRDQSTTRLQIEVDSDRRVCDINTPVGYTYSFERAAKKIVDMLPTQAKLNTIRLSGSGFYKNLGSDIINYWGGSIPLEIDESDPRFIAKGVDEYGNDFVSFRIDSFPNDLKK